MVSDMGLMAEPVSRRAGVDTPSRLMPSSAELWLGTAMDIVIRVDLGASGAACSAGEQVETTGGFWSFGAGFPSLGSS